MTTLLTDADADALWSTMPGWGIAADLTPPEIISARGLRVLHKQIVASLVLVVLVCAGGYVWASRQSSAADDRLAASQATTTQLTAENGKYSGLLALQNATKGIDAQIATLMTGDVDVAAFVTKLHAAAPAGTVLTTANITLAASAATADPSALTTEPAIGTVSLSGTSTRMVDVASYVTALQSLPGVVGVIPSTNAAGNSRSRATWTITFQLTTKLYSHRFDAVATTGTTTTGGH